MFGSKEARVVSISILYISYRQENKLPIIRNVFIPIIYNNLCTENIIY